MKGGRKAAFLLSDSRLMVENGGSDHPQATGAPGLN
jgi:hypothetical protein